MKMQSHAMLAALYAECSRDLGDTADALECEMAKVKTLEIEISKLKNDLIEARKPLPIKAEDAKLSQSETPRGPSD